MRKPLPSLSTRTEEAARREPPAPPLAGAARPEVQAPRRPADRIKDALLRWLEEEM